MILLFCMQRPDVFSYDDLAIQRGLRMVYHLSLIHISDDTADLNCEVDISASSMDMSALSGSGVEVDIYGQNLDLSLIHI